MIKSLTIFQLAEHCQAEAERYRRTGQSDETYCLELFYRALADQDERAWQAVYIQYQTLVAVWVHRHSLFSQTDEEAAFFINGAFARMWKSASKPETVKKLDRLNKCLQYLRMCVASTIEDYLRKKERDALWKAVPLEPSVSPSSAGKTGGNSDLTSSELKQVLSETIQTYEEKLVAEESWVYGLTPRQIQACYPETFVTTELVSQIKHNLLKRIRRWLRQR